MPTAPSRPQSEYDDEEDDVASPTRLPPPVEPEEIEFLPAPVPTTPLARTGPGLTPSRTGVTGGMVPQQAGTFNVPTQPQRWSQDPATRQAESRAATDANYKKQWEARNPFRYSGNMPAVLPEEMYRGMERQANVEAHGQAMEDRAGLIAQKRGEIDQRKGRNAKLEAEMRGTGQRFYTDAYGNIQPVIEAGTKRAMYHPTNWEDGGAHPESGEPTLIKRDQYGQRQYKAPKLVASSDPSSDEMEYEFAPGDLRPAGPIANFINHPNPVVARAALAANTRRVKHTKLEATAGIKAIADGAILAYDQAKMLVAEMDAKIAEGVAAGAPNAKEGGFMGFGAKPTADANQHAVDLKVKEQMELDLKPGGRLAVEMVRAKKAVEIASAETVRDIHAAQEQEILHGEAMRGEKPGSSQFFRDNHASLLRAQSIVDKAEAERVRNEELIKRFGAGQAQPMAAPAAAGPTSSWMGDMAKRAGRSMVKMPGQMVEGAGMMMDAIGRGSTMQGLMEGGATQADVIQASKTPTPGMATVGATGRQMSSSLGSLYEQPGMTPDVQRNQELFAQAADSVGSLAGAMVTPGGLVAKGVAGALLNSQGQAAEARQIMEQRGATPDAADNEALNQFVLNLPAGALESLPWANVLKRFGGANLANAIAKKYGKSAVTRITGALFGQAALEGGEEMAQQLWGNAAAIAGYDPERKLTEGVAKAGAVGSIMGGGLGGGAQVTAEALGARKPPAGPAKPAGTPQPPPAPPLDVEFDETPPGPGAPPTTDAQHTQAAKAAAAPMDLKAHLERAAKVAESAAGKTPEEQAAAFAELEAELRAGVTDAGDNNLSATPPAASDAGAVSNIPPPAKAAPTKYYRGTTRGQWEQIQRGETPQSEFSNHGLTWVTSDRESANAYSNREGGGSAVVIEYKDGTHEKVSSLTDDAGDKRRQGKLGLSDVSKVYDSKGNIIYDAETTLPPPAGTPVAQPAPAEAAPAGVESAPIQYTIQREQEVGGRKIPGYVQVERQSADGRGEPLTDAERAAQPQPPADLPTGQYVLRDGKFEPVAKEPAAEAAPAPVAEAPAAQPTPQSDYDQYQANAKRMGEMMEAGTDDSPEFEAARQANDQIRTRHNMFAPEKPGEAVAPVTAKKEPWQMSRREYAKAKRLSENPERKPVAPELEDDVEKLWGPGHEDVVAEAVKAGRPVPPEVLAEYPQLSKPTTKNETLPTPAQEQNQPEADEGAGGEGQVRPGEAEGAGAVSEEVDWHATARGRDVRVKAEDVARENAKDDAVVAAMKAAPSYPKLLIAYHRFERSLRGKSYDPSVIEKHPWKMLDSSSGVMNAKSQMAKTLAALESAVFKESGLPRAKGSDRFRGGTGVDWDRVEAKAAPPAAPVPGGNEAPPPRQVERLPAKEVAKPVKITIHNPNYGGTSVVEGSPLKLPIIPEADFVAVQKDGLWRIYEKGIGVQVGKGTTKSRAVEDATTKITAFGIERTRKTISDTDKLNAPAPPALAEAEASKPLWQTPYDQLESFPSVETGNRGTVGLSRSGHARMIEDALKRGDTVPPDVLADYPKIAERYGKTAPKTEAATRFALEEDANDWIKEVVVSKRPPKTAEEAYASFRKGMMADTRGTPVIGKDYFTDAWNAFSANVPKRGELRIDFEAPSGERHTVTVSEQAYKDLSPALKAEVDATVQRESSYGGVEFSDWIRVKQGKRKVTVRTDTMGKGREATDRLTLDKPEEEMSQWVRRQDLHDVKLNEGATALRDRLASEKAAKDKSDAEAAETKRVKDASDQARHREYIAEVEAVPLKGKSQEIEISMGKGKEDAGKRKQAAMVYAGGKWAIFKQEGSGRNPAYRITHVASGLGAGADTTLAQAKRSIQAIVHSGVSEIDPRTDTAALKRLGEALRAVRNDNDAPPWFGEAPAATKARYDSKTVPPLPKFEPGDEVTWKDGAGKTASATIEKIYPKLPHGPEETALVEWFGRKEVPLSQLTLTRGKGGRARPTESETRIASIAKREAEIETYRAETTDESARQEYRNSSRLDVYDALRAKGFAPYDARQGAESTPFSPHKLNPGETWRGTIEYAKDAEKVAEASRKQRESTKSFHASERAKEEGGTKSAPALDIKAVADTLADRLDEFEALYRDDPAKLQKLAENAVNETIGGDEKFQEWASSLPVKELAKEADRVTQGSTTALLAELNRRLDAKTKAVEDAATARQAEWDKASERKKTEDADRAQRQADESAFRGYDRIAKQLGLRQEGAATQLADLERRLAGAKSHRETTPGGKEYWPEKSQNYAKSLEAEIAALPALVAKVRQQMGWDGHKTLPAAIEKKLTLEGEAGTPAVKPPPPPRPAPEGVLATLDRTDPALAERARHGEASKKELDQATGTTDERTGKANVTGDKINKEWTAFAPESGTLGIPRAEMPQIKSEARGAMVNFLKARGITASAKMMLPTDIKPTQAEFSPNKVEAARKHEGPERPILVSDDGHIIDGHHQWMAALDDKATPMPVIRLGVPIVKAMAEVREFPSAEVAGGTKTQPSPSPRIAEIDAELARLQEQYETKSNRKGSMVPPPIKADALAGITKRMDKLDAERAALKPGALDTALTAITARKAELIKKREGRVGGGPEELFDAAHYAALDIAELAIRAGKATAEVVRMAIARFKAKFPKASPAQIAQVQNELVTYTQKSPQQQSGPQGIKNAATEAQRAEWAMPPSEPRSGMTNEEAHSAAAAKMAKDPFAGQKLVNELSDSPRAPDGVEDLLLDHELVRLHNDRNAAELQFNDAAKAGDKAAMAAAEARINDTRAQYAKATEVSESVGTLSSNSLRLRQAMLNEDYSLAAMERRAVVANKGEPLPSKLEAEVRQLAAEKAAVQKAFDDYKAAHRAAPPAPKAALRPNRAVQFLEAKADEALARIKKRIASGATYALLDPAIVTDYAVVGAYHIAKGVTEITAWTKTMVDQFGEKIREHLPAIRARAEDLSSKAGVSATLEKISKRATEGDDVTGMAGSVRRLTEAIVAGGTHGRDAVVDAVHEALKESFPDITRRETMEAMSQYGKVSFPNPDEVKAEVRDLNSQLQSVLALEDMAAGEAPEHSGLQRDPPSDEKRRLMKEVAEAKRKGGFIVTDPATQLRSALDAVKTRLRNENSDMDHQIATGKQTVATKTPLAYDTEATALKAKRDALKEQYDSIFVKPGLTDAERIELAEKANVRQIVELQRQLNTNELFAKGRGEVLTSPKLEAQRAEIAALKAERKYARELVQPTSDLPSAEQVKVEQIESQIAKLEKALASGEVFSKGKAVPLASPEITAAKDRLAALRAERDNMRETLQPSPEPRTDLEAWKARITRRIADRLDRLAREDVSTPTRREVEMDDEANLLQAQNEAVAARYEALVNRIAYERSTALEKAKTQALGAYDNARILMTTGEFSFVLRQGKMFTLSHPINSARALPAAFKALFNDDTVARAVSLQTLNDRAAKEAKRTGVFFSEENAKLSQQEEFLMAEKFAAKIPVLGTLAKRFNRAASIFLNRVRLDYWNGMSKLVPKDDTRGRQALATFINESTGRGKLGKHGEPAAVFLGRLLFSPRYLASRVQIAVGHSMWGGSMASRKAIATEYARTLIGLGFYYTALGMMLGDDKDKPVIGTEKTSSDFGKVKIGNTRLDPLAGVGQVITLAAREITGKTTSAKGVTTPIRGKVPYGRDDAWDVAGRFTRSKLHPAIGAGVNLMVGKDVAGNPADIMSEALNLSAPMTYPDVYRALKEQGLADGVALGLLAFLGEGLQTYDANKKRTPVPATKP